MLNVTAEVIQTETQLLNLWKHECSRVIADRFVNPQDNDWFLKAVKNVIDEEFGVEVSQTMHEEPYFVDFLRDMPELTGMLYFCIGFPKIWVGDAPKAEFTFFLWI